ncbi:MAG: rRNA maturation RNase YbeY [Bacteroidota bacterium]
MPGIYFHTEEVDFKLRNPKKIKSWISDVVLSARRKLVELNFILCKDQYLHKINLQYLDHDTYTDIITFDQSENSTSIEGDIFISIERVKENAKNLNIPFEDELHRVMIHGVLHLLGNEDKTEEEKALMRKKEEACLSLRPL